MKVVIDEKIPFLASALVAMGAEVVALPGVSIEKNDVKDADALFVRTRTRCDEALLAGTKVRFIGTATIGYDHIDTDYCAKNGIKWTNAAGCNADAVLQYVQSVVYAWAEEQKKDLRGLVMGIVGVGAIGSRVAAWASSVGMRIVLNDPVREADGEGGFSSLGAVVSECDIITLHPALTTGDYFPSYHLADEAFFASLKRCSLFINASRGPVVDNNALLGALERNSSLTAVLDVWEGEPNINLLLLNKVYIATPHIAGYSAEGKINATNIVLRAFASHFGCADKLPALALPPLEEPVVKADNVASALLKIYNPHSDSTALKNNPSAFENLRNNYKLRREPSAYKIKINVSKC